jgi:S1-C subfamily serine protease
VRRLRCAPGLAAALLALLLATAAADPGSAAERAGLRAGDVLVRLADTGLPSFAELRAQLGRRRPGETVQLVYLRDGLDRTTPVTLGARP